MGTGLMKSETATPAPAPQNMSEGPKGRKNLQVQVKMASWRKWWRMSEYVLFGQRYTRARRSDDKSHAKRERREEVNEGVTPRKHKVGANRQ